MKIRPLTGQVLVEILPSEKVSAGGIEIPEHTLSAEEHQQAAKNPRPPPPWTGIVREIGAWPKLRNGLLAMPEYGKGARVLVGHNAGIQMQRNIGERFRMVHQDEVLAILSESV